MEKAVQNKTRQTKLLLSIKEFLWRFMPQKALNKIIAIYWNIQKKNPKWILLNVYITGKCNLNCKSCNAFAPLADNYLLTTESFENDCKRLSEIGEKQIPEIHILGGEPLIHPNLLELLGIARKYFPNATLKIVTNGVLLSKQSTSFWEYLQKQNIGIVISNYPIKIDINNIYKKVEEYNISLRYYKGVLPWYKMKLDLDGKQNIVKNYKKCQAALQCVELQDGKIAICQLIQKIRYFNNYFNTSLKVEDADTIDVYKVKDMKEILKFLSIPAPFCKYCTLQDMPTNWEISKKVISEWV
jgi:MoaA/NifB/PqqE/SkfB family radical SAM enzyme